MWAATTTALKDIPEAGIKSGQKITITHGAKQKYAIWAASGIWDTPAEYVDENKIKTITHQHRYKSTV